MTEEISRLAVIPKDPNGLHLNSGYGEKLRRFYLSVRYGFIVPRYDGMMDERKCRFLYEMVTRYSGEKGLIVEVGSYRGCSTTWLGVAGKRKGFQGLIAIDLFTGTPFWNQKFDTYKAFIQRIKMNKLETFVKAIRGNSGEVAKQWVAKNKIAILHIDGDHAYQGVKADIENYTPYLERNGVVIFDDYDSGHPNVRKAVHELLNTGDFQILDMVAEIKKGYGSIVLQKRRFSGWVRNHNGRELGNPVKGKVCQT